jgi:ABC-2 type transport system permease protein
MSTLTLRQVQRRGTVALAGREVHRVLSLWTQTILPAVVTGALFLAIFGGVLGARIRQIEGLDYLDFILPGVLVMTVAAQSSANASTSLFQAKSEGYIEDVLTAPLRGWQLVAAYMTGGIVRSLAAALVIAAMATPFIGVVDRPLVAAAALTLTALIFSALGTVVGVWADTFDQHSFVTTIVVTPLALLGGVFYSARALEEPWTTLTRLDPIYHLVDATRYGFTGFHESSPAISLAVAGLAAVGAVAGSSFIVSRGWRLKP